MSLKVITFESLLDIKYLCGVLSDAWSCFLSGILWPECKYLILHDYVHLVLINTPLFWVVITITFTADIVDTWVFFGWVHAARESKLAPRSKKNSPKIDTPF